MVLWGANILLFLLFSCILLLRLFIYPEQLSRMLNHTGQSMFLGCVPMGLCTIINMTSLVTAHYSASESATASAWKAVYTLWWIAACLSVLSCIGLVAIMFDLQKRTTSAVNATILLPIVPLVVTAASGALIAKQLPMSLQPSMLVISFMMWGCGVSLAGVCMTVYVYRLFVEGVQPKAIVLSTLLPVGPMGQGAFGVLLLGDLYRHVFDPATKTISLQNAAVYANSGATVALSTAVALLFMSLGIFWMVLTVCFVCRSPPPGYNQSWWSMTFPIGTMTMAWYQMAKEFDCDAFRYIGAVFGCFVLLATIVCTLGSIKYALLSNTLFQQAKCETDPEV